MSDKIDISKYDKADVLRALYNNATVQGMGIFNAKPGDMTKEQAAKEIASFSKKDRLFFDYLHGRVMKVDISGDTLDPWAYDRDNGLGSAFRAISKINNNETENK